MLLCDDNLEVAEKPRSHRTKYTYDTLGRLTSNSANLKPSVDVLVAQGILGDVDFEQVSVDPYDPVANPTGSAWTFTGETGLVNTGDTNAAYLHEGTIYQSVMLVPGTYVFSFAAYATGSGMGRLEVYIDSTQVWSVDLTATGVPSYYQTAPITLAAGAHTISFYGNVTGTGQGADNILLDNVGIGMATSLIQDAGFEDYDLGSETEVYNPTTDDWTFIDNAGIALVDGTQVGFVNYGGTIEQDVYLAPGTYQIASDVSQWSAGLNLDIKVGSTTVGSFTGGASAWTTVVTDTFTISTGGTYTLSFSDVSGSFGLDNVGIWTWKQTHSFGTLVASQRIETAYNSQGLVDTITTCDNASGGTVVNQVKYDYNGFGQVNKEWQQHGSSVVTSGTAQSLAVSYAYTGDFDLEINVGKYGSRIMSMTYPSGKVLSYRYGSTNGLNTLIGRLESLAESGTVTLEKYVYLGLATVVEREQPQAGIKLTYIAQGTSDHASDSGANDPYVGLDRFGRVVDQRWRSTTGSPTDVDRYQYTYDANSNRTAKNNLLNSALNETYVYDELNRLTDVTRNGTSNTYQAWTLDALGNMTSVNTQGTSVSRSHNSQNQITAIGGTSLTYDDNGNVTTDDQGRTLVYDTWNRLVAVKTSSGVLLKGYVYDGLGRRVTETDGWGSTDLYYSTRWQVIEERKGVTTGLGAGTGSNGAAAAQYVFSPVYVDAYVLRDRNADNNGGTGTSGLEERLYVLQDANFNVTGITNSSGTVQERFVSDAYGQFVVTNASWSTIADTKSWIVQHQGLRLDAAAGWYDNRHRVYSSTMMRFGQQDPLGYVDGMNPYLFLKANVYNNLDPTGLQSRPASPRFIRAYGPGAGSIVPSDYTALAEDLNCMLNESPTGRDTINNINRRGVRVFVTETGLIWDRKRTEQERDRGVWPTPFTPKDKGLGGAAVGQNVYLVDLPDTFSMASLLVHETVHTGQKESGTASELEAYKVQTQWHIEMGDYNFGLDGYKFIVPTDSMFSRYRHNVDAEAIHAFLDKSSLYEFHKEEAKDLYEYRSDLKNWVTGENNMWFDSGTWTVEIGGFCIL